MKKLVLKRHNLIRDAQDKDPGEVELTFFRGNVYRKILTADVVLYKDKNRIRILKQRFFS